MTPLMESVKSNPVDPWPPEVEMMISALEAARPLGRERRKQPRTRYRAIAMLRLYFDVEGHAPRVLYTRNVDSRGLAFLSPLRLPLGYGGSVELPAPDGSQLSASCTIFRCREMINGWHEAALSFNTEQWIFDAAMQAPPPSMRIPQRV